MRLCPTVEGSSIPLITHRIGVESCLERQECNYHKCHRCLYRGKSAAWELPASAGHEAGTGMITGARGVPSGIVPRRGKQADKTVELPPPPASRNHIKPSASPRPVRQHKPVDPLRTGD